jgi:hypothetical protein
VHGIIRAILQTVPFLKGRVLFKALPPRDFLHKSKLSEELMARLAKPGTNDNPSAECAEAKASPPLPVLKVIVVAANELLCVKITSNRWQTISKR